MKGRIRDSGRPHSLVEDAAEDHCLELGLYNDKILRDRRKPEAKAAAVRSVGHRPCRREGLGTVRHRDPGCRLGCKIEVAASRVADLDRPIGQIDTAVAAAAQRGKVNTAVSVMEGQRKARAGLAGEREKAAGFWQTSRPNAPP